MRRLFLLRHAKSSWQHADLADHDRPLNGRGRRAATAMAGWLEANSVRPHVVLCSTAERARQTLERVLPALGSPVVSYEDGLYHASAEQLLQRIAELPDGAGEALLIGHNPGMQDLALTLAAPGREREQLAVKLPTGALVTLMLGVDRWADVRPGGATVEAFVVPRDLPRSE